MVERLVPCVSCARHVKVSESACPFCGAAVPETSAPTAIASNPLSRAAVLFVGVSVAAACGGETGSSSSSGSSTSSTTSSSSGEASSSSGNPEPAPTNVALYGPAPTSSSTSGAVPAYAAAPVRTDDAGTNG